MDPLRSDMRPAEALSGTERDARIEQLLLAGLDEYFAHRYEHAISLWTRVLFFDRHHDRARAYIERARRAQAERQRESEGALHEASVALSAGDVLLARRLASEALARGAAEDEAHAMLERIARLGIAPRGVAKRRVPTDEPAAVERAHPVSGPARTASRWTALLTFAALGALAVAAWGVAVPIVTNWPGAAGDAAIGPGVPLTVAPEPLPLPGASDVYLSRARSHLAAGRLRDALAALDHVPTGDSRRADADRLRADAQRLLLAAAPPPE